MIFPQEKLARILRCDKDYIFHIEKRLFARTGKKKVMENIVEENVANIVDRLSRLGVPRDANAKEVYDALISKVDADDHKIFSALRMPNYRNVKDCEIVGETARRITKRPKGFFIKLEKARELMIQEPPRKVMQLLGYHSVKQMLEKEDIFQVWSALRFVEGNEWLNTVFFKQYASLVPSDFEEREIKVIVINKKIAKASEKFVAKKKHNLSHLKELGVVFIIPVMLGISGEMLRMFSLLLHYLHEIPFYSAIIKKETKNKETFAKSVISLLRGDVWNKRLLENKKSSWLVVQRYLAKDNENDWRLFTPRINPEALHWRRAEEDLVSAGLFLNDFSIDLEFWRGLDWVGDYFKDDAGNDTLVSFDLVDTVMSLVKEKEMVKYLYHHQEALWNKIFAMYFGDAAIETYAKKYVLKGYFTI